MRHTPLRPGHPDRRQARCRNRDEPATASDPSISGSTLQPTRRWIVTDCGEQVGTYDTAEEAHDSREDHLARFWDWDSEHADIRGDAVTIDVHQAAAGDQRRS